MPDTKRTQSDPARFLDAAGVAHRMIHVKAGHIFFSQGAHADSMFFPDEGRAKLTVVSKKGKEATVTLLSPGDFIGEEIACRPLRGTHCNSSGSHSNSGDEVEP